MNFPKSKFVVDTIFSRKFLESVSNLMYDKHVIHHSHITGEIIGYAHCFCNRRVTENKSNIIVTSHNLFGFDFFCFLKGIRPSVWKTTDLSIGRSNLTNINFANIGEQAKFIDTMKYYQQYLAKLAETMTFEGKEKIKRECKNFILQHDYFCSTFFTIKESDREWISNYLCSRKGVIPYEMINSFDSLNIVPAEGEFL